MVVAKSKLVGAETPSLSLNLKDHATTIVGNDALGKTGQIPTLHRSAQYATNKHTAVKDFVLFGLRVRHNNPRVPHIQGPFGFEEQPGQIYLPRCP